MILLKDEIIVKCAYDPIHFINHFCHIEDAARRGWVPFKLWPAQVKSLRTIAHKPQVVVLKARQLGLTWLVVCYALWLMLFRHGAGVLLFSRRENEAEELLERMRGVHRRLPEFLQAEVTVDNAQELRFGVIRSSARCFPTSRHSGRSYSATLVVVDEADFILDLKPLLNAVKPTISPKGQLALISTADKGFTASAFKQVWHGTVKGSNGYAPLFLPWDAHPDRDPAWYARQAADYEQDDLHQEYPANPEQALSARQSSKRFPTVWLTACRGNRVPLDHKTGIPGFTPYAHPEKGRTYLVSADPAEGSPNSDPSAAVALDAASWEQVAVLHGKFEADFLAQVGVHYNRATILVERNNHGHTVLLALDYAGYEDLYISPVDDKVGWLSNRRDKVLAVNNAAKALREGCCCLNHEGTLSELAALEAATLKAPSGGHDDLAMAFINGLAGLEWTSYKEQKGEGVSVVIKFPDILDNLSF
jgi:hypothetical protein